MGSHLVLFLSTRGPRNAQSQEMSLAESMDNNHKDDINTRDDEADDDEHNTAPG